MKLKFRMYNKLRNQMVYSHEAPSISQFFMGYELGIANGIPIEIMQFTGLTDKNGVEIYSGDIIEYIDNPTNLCSGTFEVVFDAGFIGIHSHYGLHLNDIEPHKWATVIGNIHQHPNLLTK